MNKRFLLVIFAACMLSTTQSRAMEKNNMLFAAGAFGATAGLLYLTEKIAESQPTKSFSEFTGISMKDISGVIGVTGALCSLSFLMKDYSDGLRSYAIRTPIAAFVASLATTRFANGIFSKMYGIGQYLGCTNSKCNGVCEECKIRSYIKAIGVYCALDRVLASYDVLPIK